MESTIFTPKGMPAGSEQVHAHAGSLVAQGIQLLEAGKSFCCASLIFTRKI
jgi:hypothetical protein